MNNEFFVTIDQIIKEFKLEKVFLAENYNDIQITTPDINRPSLQLSGFYDYFDPSRIQVIGKVEMTYLEKLSHEEREKSIDMLFGMKIPLLVISRNQEPFEEMVSLAKKHNITLLRTLRSTSGFLSGLIYYLNKNLAKRITQHGVLVEVYGEGVLIMGDSGVGKSETAIELVKRGHRLVADDAVEIKRLSETTLTGTSPEVIRHFVELRGVGIIDILKIFGMGAIKEEEKIDIIVHLEQWEEGKQYDRLGLITNYTKILDVEVPSLLVPFKPGWNLAVLL